MSRPQVNHSRQEGSSDAANRRVAESLRELLTIVNSGLPLEEVLAAVSDQASRLLGSDESQIFMRHPETVSFGPDSTSSSASLPFKNSAEPAKSAIGLAQRERRAVAIYDTAKAFPLSELSETNPSIADQGSHLQVLRFAAGSEDDIRALAGANRSVLALPLATRREAYGALALSYLEPRTFSDEEVDLAQAFADQAALAVENAQLRARDSERTLELESLLGVARAVASTLDLRELVRLALVELQNVVNYSAASLILVDCGQLVVHDLVAPGKADAELAAVGVRFPLDELEQARRDALARPSTLDYPCVQVANSPAFWRMLAGGETVVIPNVLETEGDLAEDYRKTMGMLLYAPEFDFMRCWMAVPLMTKGTVVGYIGVASGEPDAFSEKHLRSARAFADLVSVALENAKLYEGAQRLAALDERQRLARDLHDSVAQALYGIALGAKTARKYLDNDVGAVAEPIDYVVSLAAAGLAEMRALIFDLHPDSLESEGLNKALGRQVAAIQARYGIEVVWEAAPEPPVSLGTKEALYGVLREALHNVVKHAQATRVDLVLLEKDGWVEFCVEDDGSGFDPEEIPSGHLGLRSMRERITALGGEIRITSEAGSGSTIEGRAPVR